MTKLSSLSYTLWLSVVVALTGCGGGGGGSNPPPAVSSAAASSVAVTSSSSSLASSSAPATTKLTIQGIAVAEALAGGEVNVAVGSYSVKAPINQQGQYQIALDVPNADISRPLVTIATGAGANRWVEFAALYPSVTTLDGLAGNDNLLTAEEFSGVNITALTTAEYAEIKNSNLTLTSDIERKRALSGLHPIRAVEQAAMITRLLSSPAISLPSNKQTTLDYLTDAGVAETYLEALRVSDKAELDQQIAALQDDISNVTSANLSGHFVLESQSSNYFLTLNDDGTGNLKTDSIRTDILSGGTEPKVNADFTWVHDQSSVTINFTDVVNYKVPRIDYADGQMHSCDEIGTSEVELCNLVFNSIHLDLIAESDVRYIGSMQLDVSATKVNDASTVYQGFIKSQLVRVITLDNSDAFLATELVGAEWVSKNYSFTFSADGKVIKKNLRDKTTATQNWTLTGSQLIVNETSIWISARNEAGFSVVWVDDNFVGRDALLKRAAVSMAEADWVGRWSAYPRDLSSNAYDVNADKTWRDGFEAQSEGHWTRLDNHRQTALANASWRMERDVVAIHNEKYYLSVCQGEEAAPFIPSNCYLSTQFKSTDFSSANFWGSWSYPAFNEKVSGGVWVPLWGQAIFSSNATASLFGYEFHRVSANTLFYPSENRIVEMTGASQNEIELCEYQLNQSCNPANKKTYARGVEVTLTVGAGGQVGYPLSFFSYSSSNVPTYTRTVDKVVMVPKDRDFTLLITGNVGNTINTVSGCGGTLVGTEYVIRALTEACTVTVDFN